MTAAQRSAEAKAGIAAVFDVGAPDYDQQGVEFFGPLGRWLIDTVAPAPGESLLDLACGRGACLLPAAAVVGRTGRVQGIDIAPGMVRALRADVGALGLDHVGVDVGDAEAPPGTGEYDVLTCGLGVFFLPDPAAAVQAWRRLLRPGGRVGVTVFGAWDPPWERAFGQLTAHLGDAPPTPHRLFAEGATEALFKDAGYVGVRSQARVQDAVFADVEHWWRWAMATGAQRLLGRVRAEDAAAVRARMADELAPAYDDAGLHWRPEVRVVTAVSR